MKILLAYDQLGTFYLYAGEGSNQEFEADLSQGGKQGRRLLLLMQELANLFLLLVHTCAVIRELPMLFCHTLGFHASS